MKQTIEQLTAQNRADDCMKLLKPDLPPDSLVLDFGCGTGGGTFRMASKYGFYVVGYDPDAARLDEARRTKYQEGVNYTDTIPMLPHDACYCSMVVEHIPDPAKALKSIHESLKADGLFMCGITNIVNVGRAGLVMAFSQKLAREKNRRILNNHKAHADHLHGYSPIEFVGLLGYCDFELIRYAPAEGVPLLGTWLLRHLFKSRKLEVALTWPKWAPWPFSRLSYVTWYLARRVS